MAESMRYPNEVTVRRKGRIYTATPRRRLPHVTHTCQFIGIVVCRDLKPLRLSRLVPVPTVGHPGRTTITVRRSHKTQSQTRNTKMRQKLKPLHATEASPPGPPPSAGE